MKNQQMTLSEILHGPALPITENEVPVVVLNVWTGTTYVWLGGLRFKNLITGESGDVTKEQAQKSFKISLRLNDMVRKNPRILDLIAAGAFEVKCD
jgi:hypothetical protein